MQKQQIDYEKETFTDEDIGQTDTKIQPEYYIHHAIVKAQNALVEDNPQQGFLKFRALIEHLEALANSASLIHDDEILDEENEKTYKQLLDEFRNTQKDEKRPEFKEVRIANYKFKLICQKAFENKTITSPLQDGLSSHYTKGVIDKVGQHVLAALKENTSDTKTLGHIQEKINELKENGL